MADGGTYAGLSYSAFISYSHADEAFARRLQGRLESYRLPRHVTRGRGGAVARRLLPVFRDRDELAASPDLSVAVREAMGRSAFLIVVCSEASARSVWVGREIALFRAMHGDAGVLAALVPGASEACFHAALSCGGTSEEGHVPLAAAFGREGDGDRLALLKLVAVLAHVGLDQLVQRDAQRRMRVVAWSSGAGMAGMALVAGLSLAALRAEQEASNQHMLGEGLVDHERDVRALLTSAGRLDLRDALNRGLDKYYDAQDLSRLSPGDLRRRAELLRDEGDVDGKRGNIEDAREKFEEALRTTTALLATKPGDLERIFAQAQSEYWVGDVYWRTGDAARTEEAFKAYEELAEQGLRLLPNDPKWLREVGYSKNNLGMVALLHEGDTREASRYFHAALDARLKAEKVLHRDRDLQDDSGDNYAWLGDTDRVAGQFEHAWEWREKERAIREDLLASDARDFGVRTDIAANELAEARIKAGERSWADAIRLLDRGQDEAAKLAREEPENLNARRQMRMFSLFAAKTWLAMPAPQRPVFAAIKARIGDCGEDRAQPNGSEVAEFCTILSAELAIVAGDGAARQLLQSARAGLGGFTDRLSRGWGLDFSSQLNAVERAIDKGGINEFTQSN